MKKLNFYTISLKRNILPITFFIFTIALVVFSKSNLSSAKAGLTLWATAVVPSLFPFFIATELLSYTNIIHIIGKLLNKFMRPIFNVPGEGKSEAERMLSFTNNSGPLFILGTVGITLFGNSTIGFLLLSTHILACISVGIILGIIDRFSKKNISLNIYHSEKNNISNSLSCSFSNLGEILGKSINSAISTTLLIGGFIVLFSVILSILKNSHILSVLCNFVETIFRCINIEPKLANGFITGIIELTNGVKLAANVNSKLISHNIILCAFLLGFGGFSILLQVLSIVSKENLSIKPYVIGKLMQGILAAFYTYIFINIFPFLNFDLQDVFANFSSTFNYNTYNITPLFYYLLSLFFCTYIYKINRKVEFSSKIDVVKNRHQN